MFAILQAHSSNKSFMKAVLNAVEATRWSTHKRGHTDPRLNAVQADKSIARHTVHISASYRNFKQWLMIHISDLLKIQYK